MAVGMPLAAVGVMGGFPPILKDGAVLTLLPPPTTVFPVESTSPPKPAPTIRALLPKRCSEPLPPMRKDCEPTNPVVGSADAGCWT